MWGCVNGVLEISSTLGFFCFVLLFCFCFVAPNSKVSFWETGYVLNSGSIIPHVDMLRTGLRVWITEFLT